MSGPPAQQCGMVDVYKNGVYDHNTWMCWPYHPGAQFGWAAASIPLAIVIGIFLCIFAAIYYFREQR